MTIIGHAVWLYHRFPLCVVVNGAELFLTRVVSLPLEFTRYVTARPNQIRSLSISGSDFQETRLVLRFVTVGAVSFPSGPNLKVTALTEAKSMAKDTECALLASRAAQISLVTVPNSATPVGRLMVRDIPGSGRNEYCVLVWNTDN